MTRDPALRPDTAPDDLDRALFRAVLGHYPTGVTIVTGLAGVAAGGGTSLRPIGFTIGSFSSISLDPPLVGFFAMNDSDTWKAMAQTDGFCVNVLCRDQAELCWRFARPGNEQSRFDGLAWEPAPATGCPIIEGSAAWIDCSIDRTVVLGDHELVVGAVRALDHDVEAQSPLIFYRGALGGFSADG